jgi:hypothetical protein
MAAQPDRVPTSEAQEIAALRARIAQLETELTEQAARTNAAVAAAQRRTYWLDEWKIDPNAVMRRPLARLAFKAMRAVYRLAWKARGAIRSG